MKFPSNTQIEWTREMSTVPRKVHWNVLDSVVYSVVRLLHHYVLLHTPAESESEEESDEVIRPSQQRDVSDERHTGRVSDTILLVVVLLVRLLRLTLTSNNNTSQCRSHLLPALLFRLLHATHKELALRAACTLRNGPFFFDSTHSSQRDRVHIFHSKPSSFSV
jgi:hypothetical protein